MNLDYMIDNTGYGKLSEDVQKLYKANDDGYQLNVKGVVPKAKVDEFRDNNIQKDKDYAALEKKYNGIDQDGYKEYLSNKQKINDKTLIDAGKIDELVASKIEVVASDFQAKLDTANKTISDLTSNNSSIVNKYEIQGATSKALSDNKINPTFHKPLTAQINAMFTVKEGNVVAMEGDKIMTGSNGNLTINEFVESQDDAFKIRSSGGNGQGGGGQGGVAPRTSADKIRAGLAKATS